MSGPALADDTGSGAGPGTGDDTGDDTGAGPADLGEDEETPVRPYAMVGGRTHVRHGLDLGLETLVRSHPAPGEGPVRGATTEERRILALTDTDYQSVAELSAHLRLPVGVVRVVVSDLVDAGRVEVHARRTRGRSGPGLHLLESVLDGISRL